MANSSKSKAGVLVGVGVGLGVSVLSGLSYMYYKYAKKEVIPSTWKKVGVLEEFVFFPIKSCGAVELNEGFCENLGVREGDIKDRSLMLIDTSGQMVSARAYPKMVNIKPKIVGRSKMIISAPGMDDLDFDFSVIGEESKGDIESLIFGVKVTVMDCGEEYHRWFSQYILNKSEGLRLVYYPYPFPTRPINNNLKNGICTKQDTGALQDVSSYMLINNDSVQHLNTKLKNKVVPLQFRGNFYIKTSGSPYAEDHWQWIRIGEEAIFRNVGPCFRCIMPNINPYSAERDAEGEPLATLKTYRVIRGAPTKSPVMGIQLGLRSRGNVKRGDVVYAEDLPKQ